MRCQNCGMEFSSNICPRCGAQMQKPEQQNQPRVAQQPIPTYPYGQPVYQPPKRKGLKWWQILLIVFGAIAEVLVSFVFISIVWGTTDSESDTTPQSIIVNSPSLPKTINEYSSNGKIKTSCTITEITYKVFDDRLNIYFTGEKTNDAEGTGYARSCKISWRLIDSEKYVVATGTCYTESIKIGEKFKDEVDFAYHIDPEETYTIEIMNTK